MARWEEVIDAQVDIFKFWSSDGGKRYAEYRFNAEAGTDRALAEMYRGLAPRLSEAALHSDAIYVDPHMMTVLEVASKSFKIETLRESDLITPIGFMLLPRPFVVQDRRGRDISFRAVNWLPATFQDHRDHKVTKGVQVAFYHLSGDHDDYYEEVERLPHAPRWMLAFTIPWFFDYGSEGRDHDELESRTARFLMAMWRLMQQRISVISRERPTAPFRKRAKRANFPEKTVTVIRLRRPNPVRDPDHVVREVDWSHQWLTSGHWRNQPYPSEGPDVYRQIWISPYVKGPADKPLIIKESRVYELVR